MTTALLRSPAVPSVPGAPEWPSWLAARLPSGWRTGEWDPIQALFTADPSNPTTSVFVCSVGACGTHVASNGSRCDACRKARYLLGNPADFDATHVPDPSRRRPNASASGAMPGISQFSLASVSPAVRQELLYGLQQRDDAGNQPGPPAGTPHRGRPPRRTRLAPRPGRLLLLRTSSRGLRRPERCSPARPTRTHRVRGHRSDLGRRMGVRSHRADGRARSQVHRCPRRHRLPSGTAALAAGAGQGVRPHSTPQRHGPTADRLRGDHRVLRAGRPSPRR